MMIRTTKRTLAAAALLALAGCGEVEPQSPDLAASQQPLAVGGYNAYFGNLHSHTSVSDGSGTLTEAYAHARDRAGLDFFSVSEHDYYTDDMTDRDWSNIKAAADAANDDGSFVALWGFEWTSDTSQYQDGGLGLGHFTVIGSDDYCNSSYEPTRTLDQLVAWLSSENAVAIFNHPGQYDTTFDGFEFQRTDKIVGMELWNRSEDYYSKGGYYRDDGGKGFFDEALSRGWLVGAGGGQDNHSEDWGTRNEWRTAVLATEKTRAAIFGALQARRFYSSRDRNLALSFACNGAEMGARVEAGALGCTVEALDGDDERFARIELVKNGAVVETWTPDSTRPVVTYEGAGAVGDYFYVRVYQDGDWDAISSPIFVTEEGGPGSDPDPEPGPDSDPDPDSGPDSDPGSDGETGTGDSAAGVAGGCRAASSGGSAGWMLGALIAFAVLARRRRRQRR